MAHRRKATAAAAMSFLFVGSLLGAPCLWAEEGVAGEAEEKVEVKEVTGTVSAVMKQAISIEYSRREATSYEILLPVDEKTKFERFVGLSELKAGALVKVKYQRTYKDREGKKGDRVVLKTVATHIVMLKPAPAEGTRISREKEE